MKREKDGVQGNKRKVKGYYQILGFLWAQPVKRK